MSVRKDLLILLAVLIPTALIFILIARNFSSNKINNPFATPTPYPTIQAKPTESDEPEVITPAASENIEVLSPRSGDIVTSGFRVEGNARTFENNVHIRLTDDEGNILVDTNTLSDAEDVGKFGPFEKVMTFKTNSKNGTLEVFQNSAKDGSEIDKVEIPLIFKN